jgi:hypothetical protein
MQETLQFEYHKNAIICEVAFKKKKAVFSKGDIAGIVICSAGAILVVSFFIFFLVQFFKTGKNASYSGAIASLVGALFAFNIQIVLMTRNAAKVKQERKEKTYHEYFNSIIKYSKENQAISFLLKKAYNSSNINVTRMNRGRIYQFYFVFNGPLENGKLSFRTYFEELTSLYFNEADVRIDESQGPTDAQFDTMMEHFLRFADVINKMLSMYHKGLYDDETYEKMLSPFVDENCLYLLPFLIQSNKLVNFADIRYNICEIPGGIYERINRQKRS